MCKNKNKGGKRMNFDLISNGVNIGLDIISGGAGVSNIASYISGFSLSKNIKQIESSTRCLKDIQSEIAHITQVHSSTNDLIHQIQSSLSCFTDTNSIKEQQKIYTSLLNQLATQSSQQMIQYKKITDEILHEFKQVLQSIRFEQGPRQMISPRLISSVMQNPLQAGIHTFSEFSIDALEKYKSVTPHSSPIIWGTGQNRYCGIIGRDYLKAKGVQVSYNAQYEGYSFDLKSGLYLPQIFIS